MAQGNPNPSPKTRFKPGVSGNPKGHPSTKKGERKVLTRPRVEEEISKLADMPKDELMEVASNPKTPMLTIMIASVMVHAAKEGDSQRLNFLLDRSIGRVVEKLELTKAEPFVVHRLDGSALEIGANPPAEKVEGPGEG